MPSNSRVPRGKAALATLSGAALVASSLALIGAAPAQAADPVEIQIIGTNDFHGRLVADRTVGAAKYAGVVESLRAQNPNTFFVAAGDLIGATTFESFIANDKPTIDVFNELGLDVSAVGNHELDKGYDDLVNRVMAPESESNPDGGAEWPYIAANLDEPGDADEIAPSWTADVAGVTVGFVGGVTEDLPSLVNPDGIDGLQVTDIVAATNEEAAELRSAGADLVVLLVHEGAPSTDCATMDDDPTSAFGEIVTGVSGDVDAIISGHTHLNYSCSFPVPEWATDATRAVKVRPVVSAGQYGDYLDKLVFTVEPDSGSVLAMTHQTLPVGTNPAAPDADVKAIVDAAVAAAEGPGSVELGELAGPFKRATKADGSENRGGESTLGNLVAEIQQWATSGDRTGGAQIAFMNPGGLRGDLTGLADGGYPAALTYRQAANVQSFANTLVNLQMTGAQIREALEQQWQPEGASRPFLRLGTSKGFTYTYDPDAAAGDRIGTIKLSGEKVRNRSTYSVTVNSFLAGGGDNFGVFKAVTDRRDTGMTDLQAVVDYMAAFASDKPLAVDFKQHAVGVDWITDHVVEPGERAVRLRLSSLAFTGVGDLQDSELIATFRGKELGRFAVDNAHPAMVDVLSAFDETGTSKVVVRIPVNKRGIAALTLRGATTGTTVKLPIRVKK